MEDFSIHEALNRWGEGVPFIPTIPFGCQTLTILM